MAWGLVCPLLSGCACESVGVAQDEHDHSYFRTRSVVNKVHPMLYLPRDLALSAINPVVHNILTGLLCDVTGNLCREHYAADTLIGWNLVFLATIR